jgi:hypothetical protein
VRLRIYRVRLRTCRVRLQTCRVRLRTCRVRLRIYRVRLQTCRMKLRTCLVRLRTCRVRLQTCRVRLRTCLVRLRTCRVRLQTCRVKLRTCTRATRRNIPEDTILQYHECSGSKGRPALKAEFSLPSISVLCKTCGILDISQPYRPPQPLTGIANYVELSTAREATSCAATR